MSAFTVDFSEPNDSYELYYPSQFLFASFYYCPGGGNLGSEKESGLPVYYNTKDSRLTSGLGCTIFGLWNPDSLRPPSGLTGSDGWRGFSGY